MQHSEYPAAHPLPKNTMVPFPQGGEGGSQEMGCQRGVTQRKFITYCSLPYEVPRFIGHLSTLVPFTVVWPSWFTCGYATIGNENAWRISQCQITRIVGLREWGLQIRVSSLSGFCNCSSSWLSSNSWISFILTATINLAFLLLSLNNHSLHPSWITV